MKNEIKTYDIITGQKQAREDEWKKAAGAAREASKAYMKDIDARKAALSQKGNEYQERLQKAQQQQKALSAKINDYASRGQIDDAAAVNDRLEQVNHTVRELEKKIFLVDTAKLHGDPDLYQTAQAAIDKMVEQQELFEAWRTEASREVRAELDQLKELERTLDALFGVDMGHGARLEFEKVNRHYLELDRKEREQAEKEKEERYANRHKGERHIIL